MTHTHQTYQYLSELVSEALTKLSPQLTLSPHFEHPADTAHGDFSTNIALQAFGQLATLAPDLATEYKNPRQLAGAISQIIQTTMDTQKISLVEVAGAGFINFWLADASLFKQLEQVVFAKGSSWAEALKDSTRVDQTVVVEFSSPNIAKPFTIGHLRSTIIGAALANVFEALGYKVHKDNHLGDWGTQFGKQIYAIKAWGSEAEIKEAASPVKVLVDLYIKFHKEAEDKPELEDAGREWFQKLENGDPEARRLWQLCIDWSWLQFNRIYQQLGVSFTENGGRGYGESFFEDKMAEVMTELASKKMLTDSEGAKLVFFENDVLPPLMIEKKDGTTLYATRDLATDNFRRAHYKNLKVVINEVGAEQSLYFKQLYEIESKLGWYKPGQRVHVAHGLYRFAEGKMSTRKGNVIWLEDVLNEAFLKVKQTVAERVNDDTAWDIAIGAIKWHDLRRESAKDVVFSYDEMLALQGNSGPYLQYTVVRASSILSKSKTSITEHIDTLINSKEDIEWEINSTEKELLRNLYNYFEVVERVASEYALHHLCTYLFELAQLFNSYYGQGPIADNQNRMMLTLAVKRVLEHGLGLLGIKTVAKM